MPRVRDTIRVLFAAIAFASGGCAGGSARIEQSGTGNISETDASAQFARVDHLLAKMDTSFKLLDSLRAEVRAGTLEKKDSMVAGGDVASIGSQQSGLLNWSPVFVGGAGAGGIVMCWLLFTAWGQRQTRAAERAENEEETKRLTNQQNHDHAMARLTVEGYERGIEIVGSIARSLCERFNDARN